MITTRIPKMLAGEPLPESHPWAGISGVRPVKCRSHLIDTDGGTLCRHHKSAMAVHVAGSVAVAESFERVTCARCLGRRARSEPILKDLSDEVIARLTPHIIAGSNRWQLYAAVAWWRSYGATMGLPPRTELLPFFNTSIYNFGYSAVGGLSSSLKALRDILAKESSPPRRSYFGFSDSALRQIVSDRPTTMSALEAIDGLRTDIYGHHILAMVAAAEAR